ncbi:MAG: transporter related [Gemmatimonadetes bacterium]|nr:transporter related [Gemmatimonadota bacterium]
MSEVADADASSEQAAAPAPPPASWLRSTPPKHRRRVATPTVLQMEAVECGAAALGIILEHFGCIVPLEELRVECGVSRDGSKALNMMKAAARFGLEAKGFRVELEDIYDTQLPCIVFWNFNHFVVLEGFGPQWIYLNDPASGPRKVNYQEFDEAFTGVVLTFRPGPDFKRSGRRPSLLAALRRRVRHSERGVLFAALVGIALVVPGLLLPIFAGIFVDKILVARLDDWLRPMLLAMAVTVVLQASLTVLQQAALLRLETKIAVTSSSRFLWHVLRLPLEFYSQRYGGDISSRVHLNDDVAVFLGGRLAVATIDALLVVFYLLLMLVYDWPLALIGVVAVALLVAVTMRVNRVRADGNERLLQENGKATGTILGGLSSIESVKASGGETDLFSRWAGHQAKFVNATQELGVTTQMFLALPPFLTAVTSALVLGLGALHVIRGELSMGQLVAFQALMLGFLVPIERLVQLATQVQQMKANMHRLDDVMRYRADRGSSLADAGDPIAPAESFSRLRGEVDFRDVTFGYSRFEPALLSELSFHLAPGERVALVGPSGCGKSTVAKLAASLYTPWAGRISFDGTPHAEIATPLLRNSIAMVDQEIALFEGTVRDNLTLWDATVPDATLIRAAKDACIHDDIISRQGGYDSAVSEGGANFSGGQRQRLEIARALVTNPRVLILDEATSALDTVTEHRIAGSLRERGCTCIIIAHRLSTIRDADEIIVLNRGQVVQRGTHDHLMQRAEGTYARLAHEA